MIVTDIEYIEKTKQHGHCKVKLELGYIKFHISNEY